ncbi:MAG TPA: hypothetical protein VFU79_01215 [Nitrososphaeraceae archaeon]|nr:hypothetical protein [Nitrososphaeraceae archaeon]
MLASNPSLTNSQNNGYDTFMESFPQPNALIIFLFHTIFLITKYKIIDIKINLIMTIFGT